MMTMTAVVAAPEIVGILPTTIPVPTTIDIEFITLNTTDTPSTLIVGGVSFLISKLF